MKTLLVLVAILASCTARQRWCCKSMAEWIKCRYLTKMSASPTGAPRFPFGCVHGRSTENCIHQIIGGEADLMTLDGGDIFKYRDNLTVVAAEDYGFGGTSYHAVAVVKKDARPELSLHNIAGATSCHTGVGKTAGWNMPMGWFKLNGVNPDSLLSSCAPGALDSDYISKVPGHNYAKWCRNCIGNVDHDYVCARNDEERYYGYHGALRCMQEGAGEIAFVKETIALGAANSNNLRLLCPNKERVTPSEWRDCNLGRVPSHAVVMRKDVNPDTKNSVYHYLENALRSIPSPIFKRYGGKNLLWGSKIVGFQPVRGSVMDFIGLDFFCNMYSITYDVKHEEC